VDSVDSAPYPPDSEVCNRPVMPPREEETDVPDTPYGVTDRNLVADGDSAAEP
jgi:hypothetical protein